MNLIKYHVTMFAFSFMKKTIVSNTGIVIPDIASLTILGPQSLIQMTGMGELKTI